MKNIKTFELFEGSLNERKASAKDAKSFLEVRTEIENFIYPDKKKLDLNKFEYLFDLYSEDISMMNSEIIGDDNDSFHDQTLKHQVFDYFPYDYWPARKKGSADEKMVGDDNDLATALAGHIVDMTPFDEELKELRDQMKSYKPGKTKIKRF